MSGSDATRRAPAHLKVTANNAATEILLVNASLERIEKSVGTMEWSGPPGIYKVRFLAGTDVEDVLVRLTAGGTKTLERKETIRIASPAPVSGTRTTHEYHRNPLIGVSRPSGGEIASTVSECMIFVREYDHDTSDRDDPARGLSLLGAGGRLVMSVSDAAVKRSADDRWTALTVTLPPGMYRLRCVQHEQTMELSLVLSPGWQTHVFVARQRGEGGGTLSIEDAAIFITRDFDGFNPTREVHLQTEILRQALANGRDVLPTGKELDDLLNHVVQYPMLGLVAAHIALARTTPDVALVKRILAKLDALYGHPDVDALRVAVDPGAAVTASFAEPPMLRRSLECLFAASVKRPELVSPTSMTARVSNRLLSGGVWCLWGADDMDDTQADGSASETSDAADSDWVVQQRVMLKQYLAFAAKPATTDKSQETLALEALNQAVRALRLPASVIREQASVIAASKSEASQPAAQLLGKDAPQVSSPDRVIEMVDSRDFRSGWIGAEEPVAKAARARVMVTQLGRRSTRATWGTRVVETRWGRWEPVAEGSERKVAAGVFLLGVVNTTPLVRSEAVRTFLWGMVFATVVLLLLPAISRVTKRLFEPGGGADREDE